MKRPVLLAVIKATIAVVIWGGTFVATKIALRQVQPVSIVWLRFGIGLLTLGGVVVMRQQLAKPKLRELPYFALTGFIGITFHQWLQSTGLQTSQATTTAWLVATTPVSMALLGWIALKEGLDRTQACGIVFAGLGVLMVVTKGDFAGLFTGREGSFGDLLVLISSPNWAVFSLLSRNGLKRYPASLMIFYVMASGWLLTTLFFLFGFRPPLEGVQVQSDWVAQWGLYSPGLADLGRLDVVGWTAVIFLGLFGSGVAYIFWYDALQALPMGQVGAFVYLEPFVTVLIAAVLLGDRMTIPALIGGITIICGVVLVNRPKNTG